jgi:dTDP-4-dehydrorhamnose 3,5-epimerase
MKFVETPLKGAFIIKLKPNNDERGFFARSWCKNEFTEFGLNSNLAQCNISFNHKRGTLRGMHFQQKPYEEAKLIRCTAGAMYDVIVDLRPTSNTFLHWFGIELTGLNRDMLYVPESFAHGFQTLENNTEVFYQMSQFYSPKSSSGFLWNDPLIDIKWPGPVTLISDKDKNNPRLHITDFKE